MDKSTKVFVVCIVGILGILSLITGLGAEITKIKGSAVKVDTVNDRCEYPSSPATVLSIVAVLSALMAQGIVTAATGCSKAGCSERPMRVLCTSSWMALLTGASLLIVGAAYNSGSGSGTTSSNGYYTVECYYAKPGVFAAGAFFSGLSTVIGIFYFLARAKDAANCPATTASNQHEVNSVIVAMAQP